MSCADPECDGSDAIPYKCRRCGLMFCPEHRLPEKHDCSGLPGTHNARPSQWFKSGGNPNTQQDQIKSGENLTNEQSQGGFALPWYFWLILLIAAVVVVAFYAGVL